MSVLERVAIALLVGALGFLVGLFAWWTLSDAPGLDLGWRFYLRMTGVIAIVCFLLGLWRPEKTMDVLGATWEKLWSLVWEVLTWFRLLR